MALLTDQIELSSDRSAIPEVPIWRWSVAQYHEMLRAGILTEDDPVELLDGWVVCKMVKNPMHRAATRLVRVALERAVPQNWYVDSQEPITLANSEPEPDAVVVRGDTRQYLDRHPGPQEVALVVEVADASLRHDRTLEKRVYAQAGIPVYWIVNLAERRVEVYTMPTAGAADADYAARRDYVASEALPVILDGGEVARIAVSEILP